MSEIPWRERLRKALDAEKDSEETFEQGPVGRILARDSAGNYVVPNPEVPAHFFHTGGTSANDIRAFLRAGGSVAVMEDYAGSVLRSSGIVKVDGSADIDALEGWIAAHSIAISALPGFRDKLENILQSQYILRKTIKAREEARVDFNSQPGALFLHNDPLTAVEKLFALSLPVEAMRELLSQFGGDQKAIDGLQKAVVDYLLQCVGVGIEQHPAFCEFLDKNRKALRLLFGDEKVHTFENVAADLLRQSVSLQPAGATVTTASRATESKRPMRWARLFGRTR